MKQAYPIYSIFPLNFELFYPCIPFSIISISNKKSSKRYLGRTRWRRKLLAKRALADIIASIHITQHVSKSLSTIHKHPTHPPNPIVVFAHGFTASTQSFICRQLAFAFPRPSTLVAIVLGPPPGRSLTVTGPMVGMENSDGGYGSVGIGDVWLVSGAGARTRGVRMGVERVVEIVGLEGKGVKMVGMEDEKDDEEAQGGAANRSVKGPRQES
jgi:hypothetical protein